MSKQAPLYLIANNIRSLFNVGALFRCADVFGVDKVFLCGYTATPPRKEISKTALGAEGWIAWEHQRQAGRLITNLKRDGVQIVALEINKKAIPLPKFQPRFPLALVVGNEVTGVNRSVLKSADAIVKIPMLGRKESLNVAVAAAVALYELRN